MLIIFRKLQLFTAFIHFNLVISGGVSKNDEENQRMPYQKYKKLIKNLFRN